MCCYLRNYFFCNNFSACFLSNSRGVVKCRWNRCLASSVASHLVISVMPDIWKFFSKSFCNEECKIRLTAKLLHSDFFPQNKLQLFFSMYQAQTTAVLWPTFLQPLLAFLCTVENDNFGRNRGKWTESQRFSPNFLKNVFVFLGTTDATQDCPNHHPVTGRVHKIIKRGSMKSFTIAFIECMVSATC